MLISDFFLRNSRNQNFRKIVHWGIKNELENTFLYFRVAWDYRDSPTTSFGISQKSCANRK